MPRARYNRISPADRNRTVRVANYGGNWRQPAEQLGVNHKTAYAWIRESGDEAKQKGEDAGSGLMNKSMLLLQ